MKFIVDFMLGRLCKWLRLVGYDASFYRSDEKGDIIYRSLKENRIILPAAKKIRTNISS